ncbi:MAG: transketolase, partial [Opitutaceae bacterium]|nr:transketolase [Opitutaceae bacterium]
MAFPLPPEVLQQRQLSLAELNDNASATKLRLFAWMHYARRTDNRILELFRQGLIKGTVTGGQGNEGLILPLALLADKSEDTVCFTHRDLGGHLVWSGHLCEHLNQYFANAESPTKAREGNIHHGDPVNRSLPMISHLGAMLSNVVGSAVSLRRQGRPTIGYALFGDGGSSTGDIHESLNLASLISAPVLFVIENNRYAYSTPTSEQFAPKTELWKRAAGYGIEGRVVDTTNVLESVAAFSDAIETVRATGKPL